MLYGTMLIKVNKPIIKLLIMHFAGFLQRIMSPLLNCNYVFCRLGSVPCSIIVSVVACTLCLLFHVSRALSEKNLLFGKQSLCRAF